MEALIICIIAYYCVKNTVQDVSHAITGRTPPSHERQMARIKNGTARRPARPDGTATGFFQNVYGDAWEAANDYRARTTQRAAEKRRDRWDAQDRARRTGERVDTPAPVGRTEDLDPTAVPEPTPISDRYLDDVAREGGPMSDIFTPTTESGREPTRDPLATPVPPPVGIVHDTDEYAGPGGYAAAERERRRKNNEMMFQFLIEALVEQAKERKRREERMRRVAEQDGPVSDQDAAYYRYTMRRRNGGNPMTAEQIAADLKVSPEEAGRIRDEWADNYARDFPGSSPIRPQNYDAMTNDELKNLYATECDRAFELHSDGKFDEAQQHVDLAADAARRMGITTEEELLNLYNQTMAARQETKTETTKSDVKVTIEKEKIELTASTTHTQSAQTTSVNAETTGLQAGITFYAGMAAQCTAGATNVETSNINLAAGKVGPAVTGPAAQAMEHLNTAAALFEQSRQELVNHISVQEQYNANPDAGDKAFMQNQ